MGRKRTIDNADLLRVAREVFVESGAYGSTREIAARAGISEATLFKRYPTKAALFLAAMIPPPPDVEAVMRPVLAEPQVHKALQVLALQVLAYFRTTIPQLLPIMTHPLIGLEELVRQYQVSPADTLTGAIAAWLDERKAHGTIQTRNTFASAALINSALHSIALFELMGVHGGKVPQEAVAAMMDALWDGLAPQCSPTRRRRKS